MAIPTGAHACLMASNVGYGFSVAESKLCDAQHSAAKSMNLAVFVTADTAIGLPSALNGGIMREKNGRIASRIGLLANPGLGREQVTRIAQNRQARIEVWITARHLLSR